MRLASRKARRSASALPPPRRVPQLHDEIASFARRCARPRTRRAAPTTVALLNAVLQRVHPGAATQLFGSAHTICAYQTAISMCSCKPRASTTPSASSAERADLARPGTLAAARQGADRQVA